MKAYIIIVASALVMFTSCRKKQTETPEVPEIDVARVETDSVMLHATYPGYLKADKSVDVVARVSGTVTSRQYNEGDIVRRGQVLFTIEPTKYRDAVSQAQAQLTTARASLEYATSHYHAVKKALESNAVSQMEVNEAKSAMDQADAAVKSAAAALETARTNLGYCTVTAPLDGRITAATLSVGQFVNGETGSFKLATIYSDALLKVVFNVEDANSRSMLESLARNGDPQMTTLGLSFEHPMEHEYTAKLVYAAPDVNTGTGTLRFRGDVENPYGELRDGMFVNISVPTGADPKALLVKDASLSTDQLGSYLYLVNDSNKVVYTPVKTGELYHDTLRIITSGVTPDSRYVTKALLKVRDGETVRPHLVP